MKRWFLGFLIFPVALLAGIFLAMVVAPARVLENLYFLSVHTDQVPPVPVKNAVEAMVGYCDPPEFDVDIDYSKRLEVKFLMAGDFHSDEVPYRSGEEWLGLFQTDRGLEIAKSTVTIIRGNPDELFSVSVKTTRTDDSLFLLRGTSNLKPGLVESVFNSKSEEYSISFSESGNRKVYSFRDIEYVLEIDYPNAEGGLHTGSALILKSEGRSQTITYLYDDCDDCSWSVDWVGDLDRDGKLDFLLDLSNHYNSYRPTLFLSSVAKTGKIVGLFGGFHGVGC